ncbi:hypothetical protein KY306_00575 [Candidatus Woesearchaeota archaeon]|nr:hypothetical protein [Candidatus Woesearchaeota archaeon]
MSNISNKTIFGLLIFIIALSLAGTFISLNKLGSITGFQANVTTQQGQTSATILGTASLTLYNTTMNFGAGQVNGSYSFNHDFCSLQTNATINSASNDFSGSSLGAGSKSPECVGGWLIPWSFVIENTGNSPFTNVTMNTTGGQTAFQANFTSAVTNGTWTWRFDEEGSSACTENYDGSYNTVNVANTVVCSNFQTAGQDAFLIQMNVTLPEDGTPNNWSDTITFTGNV